MRAEGLEDRALRQGGTGKLTGHDLLEADFHPATGEKIVKFSIAFLVKQGFDLGRSLVPALFEGGFPDMWAAGITRNSPG